VLRLEWAAGHPHTQALAAWRDRVLAQLGGVGDSVGETTAHGPMIISQIVNTTEKSTKPAPSRMRSQRFHKRSSRCHSARVTFIGAQLTAAMKRGLCRERNDSCPGEAMLSRASITRSV
jgi:hypothetical protein